MCKNSIFQSLIQIYAIGLTALSLYIFYTVDPAIRTSLRETFYLNKTPQIIRPPLLTSDQHQTNKLQTCGKSCKPEITNNDNTHPFDDFTKNELLKAQNILKNEFKNTKKHLIHAYWPVFPKKQNVVEWLNIRSENKKNKFDKIFGVDFSFVENNDKNNKIRKYYYIEINLNKNKIINKKLVDIEKGFPMVTDPDFTIATEVFLADKEILSYFTKDLSIKKENLKNIFCVTTAPIRDYLKLMSYVNIKHRYSFSICFDKTYTIEYRFKNQIPIVIVYNMDTEIVEDFYTCHDLGVPCIHHNKFNNKIFPWSDVASKKDIDKLGIKDNELSDCKQQRLKNEYKDEYKRPRMGYEIYPSNRIFKINNHNIKWLGWTFHESFNTRFGAMLGDIRFNNRRIAYTMHLSDIYVPYQFGDPSIWWYSKFYFDGSQFGGGWMISSNGYDNKLNKKDCPSNAHWFSTSILLQNTDDFQDNIYYACLFERYTGNPRIRHAELFHPNDKPNTLDYIELVYRFTLTVGHYDYMVDISFDMGGNIRTSVAAHGYDQLMQVNIKNKNDMNIKSCGYLTNNYCAPFHDHYFSFRVDMDVDQSKNIFYTGELKQEEQDFKKIWIDKLSKRRRKGDKNNKAKIKVNKDGMSDKRKAHTWYYKETPILTEKNAKFAKNPQNPKTWVFRSKDRSNLQYNTGYEISLLEGDINILDAKNDIRDALWTNNGLHVIKYNEDEYYATGKYPWQAKKGQGIEEYMSNNENINGEDLVAFITLAFHHVTKPEDAPLLQEKRRSFVIEPHNFFNHSHAHCGDDI